MYISLIEPERWKDCRDDLTPYFNYIKDKYKLGTILDKDNLGNDNIRFETVQESQDDVLDVTIYKDISEIEYIDDNLLYWEIYFKIKL